MLNTVDETCQPDAHALFNDWLGEFAAAFESGDPAGTAAFFDSEGYWKDILAFTWSTRTFAGPDEIEHGLREAMSGAAPRDVRPSVGRTQPRRLRRLTRNVLEGYFDFDTSLGRGSAFVRLLVDGPEPKIWNLLTTLQELRGFEERVGDRRPSGSEYSRDFAGDNWSDLRAKERAFADRDPEVVVIGGGQAGLILAARLRQIGVDTLVVEKLPRVGDNWRNRYHALTLHNEIYSNHLPYLPFPDTWPRFLPKDMLADWLEAYVGFMELNVWTGTEFVSGRRDERDGQWDVELRTPDGAVRRMRTPHLVLATGGVSGIPNIPDLPGLDAFEGEVLHSSKFDRGERFAGHRAIVVGTGNSGHDIAQDLHANGAAAVAMVQRSPTCVVSLEPSGTLVYSLYREGIPVEDADLITSAIPLPVLTQAYQRLTERTTEMDRELLDGLRRAGFRTSLGDDGTGFHMLYLRRGGGYYIDVGCSELIAQRHIEVLRAAQMETFESGGLRLLDGRLVHSDVVVLATGYKNQQEEVRRLFGDEVAERVGLIWGFDGREMFRNVGQRTAQPGFWVMAGSLVDCRPMSRFLALQIKAELEGIAPATPSAASVST